VYETDDELADLTRLLDESVERATSAQLAHVFRLPRCAMTAAELVAHFPSRSVGALATVTSRGEPRVAPVDLLFIHGRFVASTPASAFRARHLRRNPAVSVAYYQGDDVAVLAHGRAVLVEPGDPEWAEIDAAYHDVYGSGTRDWADDGLYLSIRADRLLATDRLKGQTRPG